jgi:hypothetical protein
MAHRPNVERAVAQVATFRSRRASRAPGSASYQGSEARTVSGAVARQ